MCDRCNSLKYQLKVLFKDNDNLKNNYQILYDKYIDQNQIFINQIKINNTNYDKLLLKYVKQNQYIKELLCEDFIEIKKIEMKGKKYNYKKIKETNKILNNEFKYFYKIFKKL